MTVTLASLSDAFALDAHGHLRPDWTRLRAFLDHLAWHRDQAPALLADRPPASGSLVMDTLLAGIAEETADRCAVERPGWCAAVPLLSAPWVAPGTPTMLARWETTTPGPLAQRGFALSAESLWRGRLWEVRSARSA